MDSSKLIDVFDKNTREEIRTQFTEFRGTKYLDVRIWVKATDKEDLKPTKKGITLSLELIPNLKKAVLKAEEDLLNDL